MIIEIKIKSIGIYVKGGDLIYNFSLRVQFLNSIDCKCWVWGSHSFFQ